MKVARICLVGGAALLAGIPAVMALPPLPEKADPPALMAVVAASAPISPFHAQERTLTSAIAAASPEAVSQARLDLAKFYAGGGLCVEALVEFERAPARADDVETQLVASECEYALGRYEKALARLSNERLSGGTAAVLRAMSLAQLGAFEAAHAAFSALGDNPSRERLHDDFALLRMESAFEVGKASDEIPRHDATLRSLRPAPIELIAARAMLAKNPGEAREALRRLRDSAVADVAARAELTLVADEWESGALEAPDALARLKAVKLRWSGRAFERERLEAAANVLESKDPILAMSHLRTLTDHYPRSDAAAGAGAALTRTLIALERADIPPARLAEAFYSNVEFAPPGREGDRLIREVAMRLADLDLLPEAAELLEHQVFARLRGSERASVAADLAGLYLEDQRPGEALRVLRSTRITGLDAPTVKRRKLAEATALERTGALAAAADLLSTETDVDALALRADLQWRKKDYVAAAATYRKIAAAAPVPLNDAAKNAILRAAAAYLLAGDNAVFEAFRREAGGRLGPGRERDLLDSMAVDGASSGERFLEAYRGLAHAAKS